LVWFERSRSPISGEDVEHFGRTQIDLAEVKNGVRCHFLRQEAFLKSPEDSNRINVANRNGTVDLVIMRQCGSHAGHTERSESKDDHDQKESGRMRFKMAHYLRSRQERNVPLIDLQFNRNATVQRSETVLGHFDLDVVLVRFDRDGSDQNNQGQTLTDSCERHVRQQRQIN
jgi:hypothetical protein